jgi:predicted Fe-Mo cluster-binding NifX family protein
MLILIPVDGSDEQVSKITTLAAIQKWALVDFDQGLVQSVTFHDDRTQTGVDWIDFVVLKSNFENYMDFMAENIMVLVIREEETIEEIIEAFKFKELDEVGF